MDRALLERMIGAAVLLLLLVIVAPAMLEGPREESPDSAAELNMAEPPRRVETIMLDVAPGNSALESLAAPGQKEAPARPAVESKPQPKSEPVRPKTALAESAPVKTATSSAVAGNYIVQLGIFSSNANAEKFAGRIRSRGFTVRQSTVSSASGKLYRVYVGPRKTRTEADELAQVMANSGYKGIVTSLEEGA